MTHSFKNILVIFLTVILHVHAFSQGTSSAQSLLHAGDQNLKKHPDKAFQFWEKAMNVSRQDEDWQVYLNSVNKLSSPDFDEKEKKDLAFRWCKEALNILKNAKEDTAIARLHFNTAELYNILTNEIDSPIYHFQKAKKIWTLLKEEWSAEVSSCYHGLGNIYKYHKFDFYEAEKCYEKALLIREKINFQDLDALYKNYYNLATTNRSQRDFEKALSYGTKTLEVANKSLEAANKFGALRVEMSNGMIANIYRDMKQSARAKQYYLNALALNQKTKANSDADLRDILESRAWYYSSLGETFKNDSLLTDAIAYFKKAYALYKIPELEDEALFINLLVNMLETYSLMKDEKNFDRIAKEVLSDLKSKDMLYSTEAANVWLLHGTHQQRKTNYDSALFYFQKSLTASSPSFKSQNLYENPTENMIGYHHVVTEILVKKASVLKAKYSTDGDVKHLHYSLSCLRLAEKLMSRRRNTLDMENAKWEFLESNYDLYEDIISTLYDGANNFSKDTLHALAFKYFEQSKARTLADALVEAEKTRQISGNDSLFRVHTELKRQLLRVQDAIVRESSKTGPDNIPALREEIVTLDRQIQACKFSIEEKFPGYFNVKYGYQPVALSAIQKILKVKDQVLLEYFWGNETVYSIGVSKDIVSFKRIGTPDSILTVVNKILLHLTDERSSMNQEVFNSFVKNSRDLHKMLVQPFSTLISGKKSLQIIPDGLTGQIPFEVLLEEDPAGNGVNYHALKYLIRSFTIGYAYSSAMLFRKSALQRVHTPSILAVGFTGGEKLRDGDAQLQEIAGAEEELIALEKRFASGRFLVGNEATESNFKTLAPNYDILHLAIHGTGDVQSNFAASLFFRPKYDSLDDGELHAYELYGLKLNALLAVLSSCESGLGKGYKGEGMISMASAFTYSGCENILMSLWKVNDQTSLQLMDNFYQHLSSGESIDEALRQAKLSYLASSDELTADPKVWAPLIAYGHLDKVFQKNKSRMYIITVLCSVLILLFSFKVYKKYKAR